MPDMNWVRHLMDNTKDDFEKLGIQKYRFGSLFPRYFEFWGKYVYPNRDTNPEYWNKLNDNLPVEIEDIFNNHYAVYYHLVYACIQLNDLSNPVLDLSDPFHHLGTVKDIATRVFVTVVYVEQHLDNTIRVAPLSPKDIENSISSSIKYLQNKYPSIKDQIDDFISTFKSEVSPYRDLFTHNLPLIRPMNNNIPLIPKLEKFQDYAAGRYSTHRVRLNSEYSKLEEDFESAQDLLQRLVDKIVPQLNELWETLLNIMDEIASSAKYQKYMKMQQAPEEYNVSVAHIETSSAYFTDLEFPYSQDHYDIGRHELARGTLTIDDWNHFQRGGRSTGQ